VQEGMSALSPIATFKADFGKPSCLLYPRKRTCAMRLRREDIAGNRNKKLYALSSEGFLD
jgi:hypothetical protein